MSHVRFEVQRKDPILGRKTPLMFAHRGGAGEVPESTEEAFRHAVTHGADVLELDVRLTRDAKMVVWHGPGLGKVRGRRHARKRRYWPWELIGNFYWRDLRNKVWVLHPEPNGMDKPKFRDTPDRRMLLLSEFFTLVNQLEGELSTRRTLHVNIELKASPGRAPEWTADILDKLLALVNAQPKHRTIILASLSRARLNRLRGRMAECGACHPTNLALGEQLAYTEYMRLRHIRFGLRAGDLLVPEKDDLDNVAFETSHVVLGRKLVKKVRKDGGSLYVFLTGFPGAPGIDDAKDDNVLRRKLFKLLDTGVDGVMTDYPYKVGRLIEEWKIERGYR